MDERYKRLAEWLMTLLVLNKLSNSEEFRNTIVELAVNGLLQDLRMTLEVLRVDRGQGFLVGSLASNAIWLARNEERASEELEVLRIESGDVMTMGEKGMFVPPFKVVLNLGVRGLDDVAETIVAWAGKPAIIIDVDPTRGVSVKFDASMALLFLLYPEVERDFYKLISVKSRRLVNKLKIAFRMSGLLEEADKKAVEVVEGLRARRMELASSVLAETDSELPLE